VGRIEEMSNITLLWEQAAQRDDLWEQARYEKFAELLIQECLSNLHLHGYDDALNQIKQHFKIEK
jgi:hypothetical protein